MSRIPSRCAPIALLFALASCAMHIEGEQQERDLANKLGTAYASPFAERALPPLQPDASLAQWLAHAEAKNGALEAAFREWTAAIEDVPQMATQDTTAMLGVEHTLDGGAALDRTGLMLMTDTMANWAFPGRMRDRALTSLMRAKAAGLEFVEARLRLQADVADRYVALALLDRQRELQSKLVTTLRVARDSANARFSAGAATQRELLAAESESRRATAELARLDAERPMRVAALRAIANVSAEDCADARPQLPAFAPLRDEEAAEIERTLTHNASTLASKARHDAALQAITEAEWERIPQFSLRTLLMGDGSAMIQPAFTLPFLRSHAIDARLRQAEAEAGAALALLRQAEADATAEAIAQRQAIAAATAQHAILASEVAPLLAQSATIARSEWSVGGGMLADWIEAESAQIALDVELAQLCAEAAIARAHLQHALGRAAAEGPADAPLR